MKNETQDYSYRQFLLYGGLCILNDILREFNANPSPFLNQHLFDFGIGGAFTSYYYPFMSDILPKYKDSKLIQAGSMILPTIILSAYEFASKNQEILGTYDPKDIVAYALGSTVAHVSIKLFSTKEKRKKVKDFFKKIKFFGEKNLENIIEE